MVGQQLSRGYLEYIGLYDPRFRIGSQPFPEGSYQSGIQLDRDDPCPLSGQRLGQYASAGANFDYGVGGTDPGGTKYVLQYRPVSEKMLS